MRLKLFAAMYTIVAEFVNPYADSEYEVDAKMMNQGLTFIQSIVSVVLMAIIVILGLVIGIVTTLDIMYLTNPLAHDKFDEVIDRRRRDDSKKIKFSFISKQAIDAWAEATETGKNVMLTYLRKRIIFYILAAVVMFLIVYGWTNVASFVAKMIYNLLEILGFV